MMTFPDAFKELMQFKKPELLVQFEWGYWDETITRWHNEGLPYGKEPWEDLGITFYHRAPIKVRFYPEFEEKVIEDCSENEIIQNTDGIILKRRKNRTTFPQLIKHPVENISDFERLKKRLDPNTPGRYPSNWNEEVKKIKIRNNILVMGHIEISFFGWLRDLMGLENLSIAYYEQPDLIREMCRYHLWYIKELYGKALDDIEFDCAFLWEDMAFKNGPLLSPKLFRKFMLPYYLELTDYLRKRGIRWIILDSDGNINELIPLFIEGGVDGLLPFECAAGMDIVAVRKKYPKLVIMGGLDKREIAKGKEAIDNELEKKLPFMFGSGGYLPTLDHHVPPEVSYDDFKYYIKRTREIYSKYI